MHKFILTLLSGIFIVYVHFPALLHTFPCCLSFMRATMFYTETIKHWEIHVVLVMVLLGRKTLTWLNTGTNRDPIWTVKCYQETSAASHGALMQQSAGYYGQAVPWNRVAMEMNDVRAEQHLCGVCLSRKVFSL